MSEALCRCGHAKRCHSGWKGRCDRFIDGLEDPFTPPGQKWAACPCKAYDDSRLPEAGERLEFGVHRLRDVDAEAAEAWPPMSVVASRLRAATTRVLRGSK